MIFAALSKMVPTALALSLLSFGCAESDTEPVGKTSSALTSVTFTISLPRPLKVTDVALSANRALNLADRVTVRTPNNSLTAVANSGTTTTNFGTDTRTGANVLSRAPVVLRDRARVSGGVTTASTLTQGNSVTIVGEIATNATTLVPLNTTSWSVTFPASTGNVTVNNGGTRTLAPASYGALTVFAGGTVNISAGTYYFTSFDLEPQGRLNVDASQGPVIVYVQGGNFIYRGSLSITGDPINLMIAYAGSSAVVLEASYNGTFVAPAANLRLASIPQGFTGAFFGRDLEVSPDAVVTYRQALPILKVRPPDNVQDCMDAIHPRLDLTGRAQAVAFQFDINRFCWIPTETPCMSTFVAKENADSYVAAVQLLNQVISPAAYLGLVRDRIRKHRRAQDNASYANSVCTGTDSDGDWIPNPQDQCPGTPDLTPTGDNGCPTPLPPGPNADDVHTILTGSHFGINPFCANAHPPSEIAMGAFNVPADPTRGTYVFAQRVLNQPPGCAVWYEFEIESTPPGSTPSTYRVAFMDNEELTGLVGTSAPVRPQFIQFNPLPNDAGTRGRLGSERQTTLRLRVRAANARGSVGAWSPWKLTTIADCVYLNIPCGQ